MGGQDPAHPARAFTAGAGRSGHAEEVAGTTVAGPSVAGGREGQYLPTRPRGGSRLRYEATTGLTPHEALEQAAASFGSGGVGLHAASVQPGLTVVPRRTPPHCSPGYGRRPQGVSHRHIEPGPHAARRAA
jgi:hypothetical protein